MLCIKVFGVRKIKIKHTISVYKRKPDELDLKFFYE